MIQISIGGMPRDIQSAEESWITEQVNKRLELGEPVCVKVTIKTPDIDLTFSSSGCPKQGGGLGRELTRTEAQAYDLWKKRGLGSEHFSGGNVVAFLKQLQRIV